MKAKSALIASIATVGIASGANAQVWNEVGDAGDLIGTANQTSGVGPLTSITGVFPSLADIDMYLIQITNEAAFTAAVTTYAPGDSQLYLFSTTGVGLDFDDDGGPGFQSAMGSGNVLANGFYYLAIADFDADALNLVGGTQAANGIWHDGAPYTGPMAPDGPGSANPVLAAWATGNTTTPVANGQYTITLTGASFAPAPGAMALLGLAGLVGARRRRR